MFGILCNGDKLLCYVPAGIRRSFYNPSTGKVEFRTIWQDKNTCLDPYMAESEQEVLEKIQKLSNIYLDVGIFYFTQEYLDALLFRKLRGY